MAGVVWWIVKKNITLECSEQKRSLHTWLLNDRRGFLIFFRYSDAYEMLKYKDSEAMVGISEVL